MTQYISYDRFDPFRKPDWRYQRVLSIVQREPRPGRCTRHDDKWVRGLRGFILRYRNADAAGDTRTLSQLKAQNPGLYFAYEIHKQAFDRPVETFQLRARILARQDDEIIADARGTLAQTIHWYEKLFFNVRDRISSQDWVVREILYPAIVEAQTMNAGSSLDNTFSPLRKDLVDANWDPRILWFSYFWGANAVDFFMTGFKTNAGPRSQEEMGVALENFARENLGQRTNTGLHALPMNKYNVTEIASIYGQFLSIAKADSEEAEKQTMLERSVNAMMTDMPWSVGDAGEDVIRGSKIEQYDNSAVELRTDQLLQLGSGGDLPSDDVAEIQKRMQGMPDVPEQDDLELGQEDVINGNA